MLKNIPEIALVARQKTGKNIDSIGPWCHLDEFKNGDYFGFSVDYFNPFDDELKKNNASKKALEYHDRITTYLAYALNKYHGRNYSHRYWSILLSKSVISVIESVLYKIAIFEGINKLYKVEVYDLEAHPRLLSTRSLIDWINSDDGVLYIFSHIIQSINMDNIVINNKVVLNQKRINVANTLRNKKKLLIDYVKVFFAIITNIRNGIYIDSIPGMTYKDVIFLQLKKRKGKKNDSQGLQNTVPVPAAGISKKQLLSEFKAKDRNESVIFSILSNLLPSIFFENYKKYELSSWLPSYIVSRNYSKIVCGPVLGGNDIAKFVIAKCVNSGTELIVSQHGTNYGTSATFTTMAAIEYKNCDKFLSWGWLYHSNYKLNVDVLPSPYLSKLSMVKKSIVTNEIIFVGNNLSLYGDRICSSPNPQEFLSYLKDKLIFIRELSEVNKKNIKYKPYPVVGQCLIDEAGFISRSIPTVSIINGSSTSILTMSRLIVVDHPGTIMLERLSRNMPIVLYWNDMMWSPSEQSRFFFEQLKDVGILHDSPISAAKFVNITYDKCEEWWFQQDVQRSVSDFVNNYANISEFFIEDWQRYLSC